MCANYKVVVFGESQVGKSCLINRFKTGEFNGNSDGSSVNLSFNTNYGSVNFECIENNQDISKTETADAVIYLFDVTQKETFKHLISDYDNFLCLLDKPVVYCGNKCDTRNRKVKVLSVKGWLYDSKQKYYEISARNNYNTEKPFLSLARELLKREDLRFIENSPITPVEIILN